MTEQKDRSGIAIFSSTETKPKTALETQIGGNHYKDFKIQPVEFCMVNKLNYCQSNVIKYICRYNLKDGLKDLEKAKHYIDLLIEMEYSNVVPSK